MLYGRRKTVAMSNAVADAVMQLNRCVPCDVTAVEGVGSIVLLAESSFSDAGSTIFGLSPNRSAHKIKKHCIIE